MEERWAVEKLEGPNWITWKFQLRHLLMAKGLWKFVDGSAVLADDAAVEAIERFRAEQQKAFSTIVMSVSSSLLYLITSCELPKDAWDALKKHYEHDTLANKLFLKKQYFRKLRVLQLMCA
jgi:dsDNA-binding SOS-regulon protein